MATHKYVDRLCKDFKVENHEPVSKIVSHIVHAKTSGGLTKVQAGHDFSEGSGVFGLEDDESLAGRSPPSRVPLKAGPSSDRLRRASSSPLPMRSTFSGSSRRSNVSLGMTPNDTSVTALSSTSSPW